MRALGLSGAHAARTLKESGRSTSDSRIGRSYMPPASHSAAASPASVSAVAVSAPALKAGEDEKPKKRLSFWQRRRTASVAGPVAKGVQGLPSEMDDSWDTPCDALAPLEWVSSSNKENGESDHF